MHTHDILYRGLTIVMLVTLLLLAASLPGIAVPPPTRTGWREVGAGSASGRGISDNNGDSVSPSVAIMPDGRPYAAWHGWSGGFYPEIYVRRWVGQSGGGETVYLSPIMKDCDCGPDNYEPNDWFDQAYGPLISVPTYQSYISCCDYVASQRDYFYIDVSMTNAINIDLTNIPADCNYDVYLYNSARVRVGQSESSGNVPEHISYNPPSAGRYYILVSSLDSYSDSPYSLQVTYDGCYGPDNYEPNDWCVQAYGPLTSGQIYQSWISCHDLTTYKKSDYFFICSTGNAYINIYLADIPAGTDYDLYLYKDPVNDPSNPVAKSEGWYNSPETISYPPYHDPLMYYIRVYAFSGYSASPYSLTVTYDPCPVGPTLYLPIIFKNYLY